MDKLSLEEAGCTAVLSVPDGAPASVREELDPQNDVKFSYLGNCQELFKDCKKVTN